MWTSIRRLRVRCVVWVTTLDLARYHAQSVPRAGQTWTMTRRRSVMRVILARTRPATGRVVMFVWQALRTRMRERLQIVWSVMLVPTRVRVG